MASETPHLKQSLDCIRELKAVPDVINLDGHKLTVAALKRIASDSKVKVKLTENAVNEIEKNAKFLQNLADNDSSGADIAMAAYMSELDHVVNPMSNHVVSAELHNQSVNSLALISCRLTKEALEIIQMMLANHLNMLVQAVDLRYLRKLALEKTSKFSSKYIQIADCIQPKWYEFMFTPMRR
ncbi:uncharacterized protein LOC132739085 [Ruditapes philippinarum]|uniref:uncharacterized protein LOC132739085 n=1 Tax=Ruditapes philippinarum TaxID=129788 RepID=UPI00295B91DC|nr:uncharacterized protein LOC132739085 [Ruditapes philippinarum]